MNIRNIKKLSLLSSLVIIFCSLSSCKNTYENLEPSEKIPDWCTIVSFAEHNFSRKAAESSQNFYIPDSSFSQENITEYELTGNYIGTVDYSKENNSEKYINVNKAFEKYEDLLSYTQTLALGKWKFTLNAKVLINNQKVIAFTSIEEVEFTKEDHSVTFNLETVQNVTGSVKAEIKLPVNYSDSAKYQISRISEDKSIKVIKETSSFDCTKTDSYELLAFKNEIQLEPGSYILLIQLFNGTETPTDSKYIAFTVEACCVTTIDRVYEENELNNNYSIKFHECAQYTSTYYYNRQENVTLPKIEKTGYEFLGWAEKEGETDSSKIFNGWKAGTKEMNLLLYAVLNPISYKITYDLQKGSYEAEHNPDSYTIEDNVTLISPVRKFFEFDGWYNEGNSKVESISQGTTGEILLTARWTLSSRVIAVGEITFPQYSSDEVTIEADPIQADFLTAKVELSPEPEKIVWSFGGTVINRLTNSNFYLDIKTYSAGVYELMVVIKETDGTTKSGTCTVQITRDVEPIPGV